MVDTMDVPVADIVRWLLEVEEQIKKTEIKAVRDFLHGEQHVYVRILRKYGWGKEFQDFRKKWCDENKIDPTSMRCLVDD